MRWTLLGISVAAFAGLWGVGPAFAVFAAFLVMFANFATFCLLYDQPKDRARQRIQERLRQLNPNTDMAQRLSTARAIPTAEDRRLGFGPLTLLNLATGIAATGLLVWGVGLRVF